MENCNSNYLLVIQVFESCFSQVKFHNGCSVLHSVNALTRLNLEKFCIGMHRELRTQDKKHNSAWIYLGYLDLQLQVNVHVRNTIVLHFMVKGET